MTVDRLADVVAEIIESADEVKGKEQQDDQDYGQLLAYAEVLSILRDACDEEDLEEVGLAFDIDKRYLF